MPRPRWSPERGHILCAILCNQNAPQHFLRGISYEASEEPLDNEVVRQNAAAQIEPRTRTHILRKRAQSKYTSAFHKRHQKRHFIYRKLQLKYRRSKWVQNADTHFVWACTVETNVKISRAPLLRKFQETRDAPEHGHPFCASLRSRNARQDLATTTSCGNLLEKSCAPEWAPWSRTGLYSYRKNPSGWAHCVGKNKRTTSITNIRPNKNNNKNKTYFKDIPARDPRQFGGVGR